MKIKSLEELEGWVSEHAEHLKDYTREEIAILACACNFDRSTVAEWESKVMKAQNFSVYQNGGR